MDKETKQERNRAVAISYDKAVDGAPKVVAKGSGAVAERIIEIARENKIPLYKNKTLSGMLMAVELDREIPPALYQAVAEILAHVYRVDRTLGEYISLLQK